MATETNKRLSYIDILKVIAAFMIVMLHVSASYIDMSNASPHGLEYFFNSLTRIGLPIFFMISGALLLRDEYHFKLKRKFFFILKIYIFWSAFYVLVQQVAYLKSGNPLLSLPEMIVQWIRGPYHFWYLAMLLGFYLLMPLFSKLKDFQTLSLLIGLSFLVIYVIQPFSYLLPDCINTFIKTMIIFRPDWPVFYFFLGAWIHRFPLIKKFFYMAWLSIFSGLFLHVYQLYHVSQFDQILSPDPFNLYAQLLTAAGLFYLARYLSQNIESGKLLRSLSKGTLHIYITSAFFIYLYEWFIKASWDALVPSASITILIWSIVVFICSYTASILVMKKNQWLQSRPRH